MSCDVACTGAGGGFPFGAGFAAGATGVEAEAGDGHEDVAVAGVDGDPFAIAFFAVV